MQVNAISLKIRLILSMVLLSIFSIATVGWFAHAQLIKRFDEGIANDVAMHINKGVSTYIATYGSWEEAEKKESLFHFLEKHPEITHKPHSDEEGLFHLLGSNTLSKEIDDTDHKLSMLSMQFHLFDPQFRSLVDLPPYRRGFTVLDEDRNSLKPILMNGKVVAYFLMAKNIIHSPVDDAYAALIRKSLITGSIVAALMALVVGSLMSLRLVRRLEQLTEAVNAIDAGQMNQFVEHAGNDEIGKLAQAFNRMSERLYLADKHLRESHQQIEEQAKLLKEQSFRDPLTRLYNRRYIDQTGTKTFEHAVRLNQPFSAMIGDIDFFKSINDRFSHAIGDLVLQEVATILLQQTRTTDIVARYGGEEFVILFPEVAISKAAFCCEQIRLAITQHNWQPIHPELQVSISIGLAEHTEENSLSTLIRHADLRLYKAKSNGRNQVVSLD